MTSDRFEVVVAGGGVAGVTAAMFAARAGRATKVLLGGLGGGYLTGIARIEDYPGFPGGVAGYDLFPMLQEQAEASGVQFGTGTVQSVMPDGDGWSLETDEGTAHANAVILATGTRLRRLEIPGEERFQGLGISDCASCDGPMYRGGDVAVVGGGDSALLEALELAEHVERVVIFQDAAVLTGQRSYAERVFTNVKIEVRCNATVEAILGDTKVSGLRVAEGTELASDVPFAGVFIFAGVRPNTEFLVGAVALDADGRILTDGAFATDVAGVFAAGDVRSGAPGQAVSAAGDGAGAGLAAHRYLAARAKVA